MISIVSPTDLLHKIQSEVPNLRLVDARGDNQTAPTIWPGAIRLRWEDFCAKPVNPSQEILLEPGYWGALRDDDLGQIAQTLSSKGLSADDEIIVFADGAPAKGREGRVAWMLAYLGGKNISLLDADDQGWAKALINYPSKNHPALMASMAAIRERRPHQSSWQLDIDKSRRCTMDELTEVRQSKDNGKPFVLVDTRSKKEFIGESYDYQPRLGHIPDAVLFPFLDFFGKDRNFIDQETYIAKMAALANVDASLQAIQDLSFVSYCEVGVRAALLACLHEHHTGKIMRVYDGSIMEWGANSALPVVMGECLS